MSSSRGSIRSIPRQKLFPTLAITVALLLFSTSVVFSQHYNPVTESVIKGFGVGWTLFLISVGITSYVSIFHYHNLNILEKVGIILHGVGALGFVTAFPYLTGSYMVGRSDTMAHLGWIKDIVDLGIITPNLIYPTFHLFSATNSLVVGIEPRSSMVITIILTIFGSIGAIMAIVNRFNQSVCSPMVLWGFTILIFLALPFRTYHISYYPAGLSTLYLPIAVLATYHIFEGKPRSYVMLIFTFVLLTHPFGFIYVLLLLSTIALAVSIRYQLTLGTLNKAWLVIPAIVCVFLIGYLWYDHSGVVTQVVVNTYTTLGADTGTADNLQHTTSTIRDLPIIEFILLRYSPHVYLLPVTIIVPILVFYKNRNCLGRFVPLYLWGGLSLIIGVIIFMATSLVGPLRFLDASPAVWISILALLYLGTDIDISYPTKKTFTILVFVLLIITLPITLFTAFPSPLTYQHSWDVSHEDKATVVWWVGYGDEQYTESLGMNARMFYSTMGFTEFSEYEYSGEFRSRGDRAELFDRDELLIQSVNIGERDSLSALDDGQLIIITNWHTEHAENERLTQSRTLPSIQTDYDRSGSRWLDQSINRIYSNGNNIVLKN